MKLLPVAADDVDELHALYTDPRVWEHFPSLRHTRLEQTEQLLAGWIASWSTDGLSQWTLRTDDEEYVGHGGARAIHHGLVWNVGYRIRPEFWGRGLGTDVAVAAIAAAHEVEPARPVIAYLVEHNVASLRTAERAGLTLVWRGPDAGNPDPEAVRLVLADRPLDQDILATVTAV